MIIILIVILIIVLILVNKKNNNSLIKNKIDNKIDYKKYYKPKIYITTINEMKFYNVLLEIAKELDYLLFTQVSLYNIVQLKDNNELFKELEIDLLRYPVYREFKKILRNIIMKNKEVVYATSLASNGLK